MVWYLAVAEVQSWQYYCKISNFWQSSLVVLTHFIVCLHSLHCLKCAQINGTYVPLQVNIVNYHKALMD